MSIWCLEARNVPLANARARAYPQACCTVTRHVTPTGILMLRRWFTQTWQSREGCSMSTIHIDMPVLFSANLRVKW